jgi:hypothetical protein
MNPKELYIYVICEDGERNSGKSSLMTFIPAYFIAQFHIQGIS